MGTWVFVNLARQFDRGTLVHYQRTTNVEKVDVILNFFLFFLIGDQFVVTIVVIVARVVTRVLIIWKTLNNEDQSGEDQNAFPSKHFDFFFKRWNRTILFSQNHLLVF